MITINNKLEVELNNNFPSRNIHIGMKTRAKIELRKVMVMDMLMSPFKRSVQKFDPVPPGQQPSTNRPSLNRIANGRKNTQI